MLGFILGFFLGGFLNEVLSVELLFTSRKMAAQEEYVREVEGLMAESFGDPQLDQLGAEVTMAVRGGQSLAPLGVPVQPSMLGPLASNFSFWRSRVTCEQVDSFIRKYNIDP